MATAAILVNGLPASGKSTIAVKLSVLLGCPVFAGDAVLESLADLTGQTVPGRRLRAIAMDTVWSLAAAVRDGCVVDSFWYSARDRELALQGVAISGATHVVELWCDVAEHVARERYAQRERQDIHGARFGDWVGAAPLDLWPVVRVDTSKPVDYDALLPALASHLL